MFRYLIALALVSTPLRAQFYGLATPFDGSVVYFTSTLRLKGTTQPLNGKVFAADESGVRLVESRERVDPVANGTACVLGWLYFFGSVEVSGDDRTLAAHGLRAYTGVCRGFMDAGTLVRTTSGAKDYSGYLRLSANGRYAVADQNVGVFTPASFYWIDLATGEQKTIRPDLRYPATAFAAAGRTIADDGSFVFTTFEGAYLLHPDGALQLLPASVQNVHAITPDGRRLLYSKDKLRILDLRTGDDHLVATASALPIGISDDGSRAAFVRNGQLFAADLDGVAHPVGDASDVYSAVLSGDGKVVYVVTLAGRLVRIAVDTAATKEIIGSTPDVGNSGWPIDGGMFFTIAGRGFSDTSATAPAPLPDSLAGVSVAIGGRKAPLALVTPTEIDVLVPPGTNPDSAVPFVVTSQSARSPFDPPEGVLRVFNGPRAGAIAHQNWDSLVTPDNGPHVGEIIHVWAVGFGDVTPDLPLGAVAPSVEPLPRLRERLSCSNSEILYAGLAPGYIARIYQVDMRIGPTAGYQPIECSLGATLFRFLTLNVLP